MWIAFYFVITQWKEKKKIIYYFFFINQFNKKNHLLFIDYKLRMRKGITIVQRNIRVWIKKNKKKL